MQYKEVFKIADQGQYICICMKHFKEMCATSHYMLIDTNECIAVPLSAVEESAPEVDEVDEVEPEPEVEEVEPDRNHEEAPAEEEKPKKKDKKDKKKEDK